MCTGSFPGIRCCRGVTLTPHPLLVQRSKIEYSYTSTLPKGLRGLWKGETCIQNYAPTVFSLSLRFDVESFWRCRLAVSCLPHTQCFMSAHHVIWTGQSPSFTRPTHFKWLKILFPTWVIRLHQQDPSRNPGFLQNPRILNTYESHI